VQWRNEQRSTIETASPQPVEHSHRPLDHRSFFMEKGSPVRVRASALGFAGIFVPWTVAF
jgi:hypothetical protein